jgi:hypothetical protein
VVKGSVYSVVSALGAVVDVVEIPSKKKVTGTSSTSLK